MRERDSERQIWEQLYNRGGLAQVVSLKASVTHKILPLAIKKKKREREMPELKVRQWYK